VIPRLRTEPEASEELAEAGLWYEKQRSGLGIEFLEEIDATLDFITRFPQAGSPVPDVPKDLPVRRTPLHRFPFQVVYLELSDTIRVLAFAHDRRVPGYWRYRI
jgi:plasmid stabilization system protein ParE